ncbi:MAG: Rieske (2Fe-2S) protein [Bacteroidetes bacterium]|nr:Rieske (2Fe-2S) protein [Bacteroidota bacterium]HET6243654.1 Rieske (2Fe-2S) protein [Bacteroidia bacterium]
MIFRKKIIWYKVFDADFLKLNEPELKIPIAVHVANKSICLIKLETGYFAVNDICPHQGASLSSGHCSGENIVCPWHKLEFNLVSGRQAGGGGDYVRAYPVELRADGLYIGIEKTVFSLFE